MKFAITLVAFFSFIAFLFRADVKRRPHVSRWTWLVFLWVTIIGSRPVSTWFGYSPSGVDAYVEGNAVERAIFFFLIIIGFAVLYYRRVNISAIISGNIWLFACYAYWIASVLWADDSFIAFKRLFKDFGNVVMVLVILTDPQPLQAIKAVFVRCSYLLVLMSVLFIRYWTELGRTFTGYNANDQMYVGVCTHKNTLGCLLIVCCVFLVWDLIDIFRERRERVHTAGKITVYSHIVVLAMTAWLLSSINSATSLVCSVMAVSIIFAAQFQAISRRYRILGTLLVIGGILIWVLDDLFNLKALVLLMLGRDSSLTGRTEAWTLVLDYVDNPVLGAGFKSFWAGERMTKIWLHFSGVVQAHSGYVESYLNGGIVGVALIAAWLLSSYAKIKASLLNDPGYGRIRLSIFLVSLVYNYSEATFFQLSIFWFALLAVTIDVPSHGYFPFGTKPRGVAIPTLLRSTRHIRTAPAAVE